METVFKVGGMTCGGCASAVTRAISASAPGTEVVVNLDAGQVKVTGQHSADAVKNAVEDAGFDFGGAL